LKSPKGGGCAAKKKRARRGSKRANHDLDERGVKRAGGKGCGLGKKGFESSKENKFY